MIENDELNQKQNIFAREYIIDLNATQAAIRAGYSENTADVQGSRLLGNVKVQAYISYLMDERSKRLEIKADNVLKEIAKLAFANIKRLYDENGKLMSINELADEVAVTLQEITEDTIGEDIVRRKYKLADKKGNLELLGRHLKLFTDKVEMGGGLKTVRVIKKRFDGTKAEEGDNAD